MLTKCPRRSTILSAMAMFAVLGLSAHALTVAGPFNDRVYQRGDDGTAAIEINAADFAPGAGTLRAAARDGSGKIIAEVSTLISAAGDGGSVSRLTLPTGGPYEIAVNVHAGVAEGERLLESQTISGILVGDLWVMAGQSNMEGCSRMENVETPSPMVHVFELGNNWRVAADPLCDFARAADPVHWRTTLGDSDLHRRATAALNSAGINPAGFTTRKMPISNPARNALRAAGIDSKELIESLRPTAADALAAEQFRSFGAGLGVAFGKELYSRSSVPVGLFFAANGGTSMEQWDPELSKFGGESLYGSMISRINSLGGRVAGFLWYQGENDSLFPEATRRYTENTVHFFESVRRDLGSDLPILLVQLARQYDNSGQRDPELWNDIQRQQLELEKNVPRTAMAVAINENLSDFIHVDALGQRALGRSLAKLAAIVVHGDTSLQPGPRFRSAELLPGDPPRLRLSFSGVNGALAFGEHHPEFILRNADGARLPVLALSPDPEHPDALLLTLAAPLPPDATVQYGAGFNPLAGIDDDEGMQLPAFGPIDL